VRTPYFERAIKIAGELAARHRHCVALMLMLINANCLLCSTMQRRGSSLAF
jgi:hypothetical protein